MLKKSANLCLLLMLLAPFAGCADVTPAQQEEMDQNNDPFEAVNRRSYENNYFLDRLLMRPIAELYRVTVPPPVRDRIAGIVANMKEPVIFVNDMLQGEFGKAGTTIERLTVNSTLGVGGMWDVAGGWGLRRQTGDFGQTLASWGVGEGPYLMLPLYGPSNVRDAVGRGVDMILSPWQYVAWLEGGTGTLIRYEAADYGSDALVRRERNIENIDAIRANAVDPYTEIRSMYRQYRRKQLGQTALPEAMPDIPDGDEK